MPDKVPLREHLESKLNDLEKLFNSKLADRDQAITIGLNGMEKRFDGVNEFRQTLSDQTKTFVTREVLESVAKAQDEKIRQLELKAAENSGKATQAQVYIGYAMALALFVIEQYLSNKK